jgi:hypothetical protein
MSYAGITPTKFGRIAVAEPFRAERFTVVEASPTTFHTVDWESPIPVLDQEDLGAQGIDTSQLVKGAPRVDALGSCVANGSAAHLGQVLRAAGVALVNATVGGQQLSLADAVASEKWAICFYNLITDETGDPAQEWPPNDCGSSGYYAATELEKLGYVKGFLSPPSVLALVQAMQTASAIVGGPWYNAWMEPGPDNFIDGDGSPAALQRAIGSGLAGGHERHVAALEHLVVDQMGHIDWQASVVRERNSWSRSWADNGSHYVHLSTYRALGSQQDYKQLTVVAA